MKKVLYALLISLTSFNIYSQTSLDVIRASNYYAKATTSYSNHNYTNALGNLVLAEKNLKGKTNKDLEFLKTMTNYRLKNFKEAYVLIEDFFNKNYSSKNQYFRNVDSYNVIASIDYEEELTNIFVDLEDWNNLAKDIEPSSVAIETAKALRRKLINKINKINSNLNLGNLYRDTDSKSIDHGTAVGTTKFYYENNITEQPYFTEVKLNMDSASQINFSCKINFQGEKKVTLTEITYSNWDGSRKTKKSTKYCDTYIVYYIVKLSIEPKFNTNSIYLNITNTEKYTLEDLVGKRMGGYSCNSSDYYGKTNKLDSMLDDFLDNADKVNNYFKGISIELNEKEQIAYKKNSEEFRSSVLNYLRVNLN